jgi:hypothetical protein
MVLGKIACGGAIPHWGVDKRDEFSHVLDRESKIAAAGNEQETLPVGFAVDAVPTGQSLGFWEQADLFVVPDRRHAASRFRCERPDRQVFDNRHIFSP